MGVAITNKMEIYSNHNLQVLDWGITDYGEAFRFQKELVAERIGNNAPDRLVITQHHPVVTIGRSGSLKDLRTSKEALLRQGVPVYCVDRGGMATFHGPGQLVAYPIIKLKRKDLHQYLQTLIDTVAAVLQIYGLKPQLRDGEPGVWVGSAKVASIGITVRRWVTYHGVALNVNTSLKWFKWIVPCGHPDEQITSMKQELGHPLDMAEVKGHFLKAFCRLFRYTAEPEVDQSPFEQDRLKHPAWLVRTAPSAAAIDLMEQQFRRFRLATVCQSALCPNMSECFQRRTVTFMILGTQCTRRCGFCAVNKGAPQKVDLAEPERVAQAARLLGLKHVVVTSVTRDDLPAGGAGQFVRTIDQLRRGDRAVCVEVLVPDFKGSLTALQRLCEARPDVFNHNIETVAHLYPNVRPQAQYRRSLGVLEYAATQGLTVKSGIMLGLGETDSEVMETITDLKRAGCLYLTIGQYLAPSRDHIPVARYVPPEEFQWWEDNARAIGFKGVAAGPLVRSSYRADEMLMAS